MRARPCVLPERASRPRATPLPSTMASTVLTTDCVRPAERAAYWSDLIWRSFGRLRSDTYGDDRFCGHIALRDFGNVRVSRLDASRHRVVRTAGSAGLSDPGYVKLVVQHSGHSLFEQNGRRALLGPGTWSVYDTTRSYTVATPDAVSIDVLLLPRDELLQGRRDLEDLFVRRLSARTGISRLACATIRSAVESTEGDLQPETGDTIVRLVRLALFEHAGIHRPLSPRWILRDRIKELVGRRLADPSLDSEAIARALNCSKRSLHKAFEGEACTLHQHIWEQRLESARRELEQPRHSARSITEIAFAWGFTSPAHFSRAFRARFGASPREWRAGARESASLVLAG